MQVQLRPCYRYVPGSGSEWLAASSLLPPPRLPQILLQQEALPLPGGLLFSLLSGCPVGLTINAILPCDIFLLKYFWSLDLVLILPPGHAVSPCSLRKKRRSKQPRLIKNDMWKQPKGQGVETDLYKKSTLDLKGYWGCCMNSAVSSPF